MRENGVKTNREAKIEKTGSLIMEILYQKGVIIGMVILMAPL